MNSSIRIIDTTLRDGSHAVSHGFTTDNCRDIAKSLDNNGVFMIEVTHGDGLGGSSINYGKSKTDEIDLIRESSIYVNNAMLAVLLLPGIGTISDLKRAHEAGAKAVRVATHVTEADIAIQHLLYAKNEGMFTVGFLMMSHMAEPECIIEQAKIFVDCGVDYINLADSAGYMLPEDVKKRIASLKAAINTPIGFHAHNNLGMALANSLMAIEEGAEYIDASCRGLGAGAGNTQLEVLAAILDRKGIRTGLDLYGIMDLAEKIVEPIMLRPQLISTSSLMLGYAGVYSSFLLHTFRAAEKFDINPRDILVELGKRKMVGGQEDMIVDVAYNLSKTQKKSLALNERRL